MKESQIKQILRAHLAKRTLETDYDIFVVWSCKTLQNRKWLLGTSHTDYYYELTYNGDKDELYIDTYEKVENTCIKQPFKDNE